MGSAVSHKCVLAFRKLKVGEWVLYRDQDPRLSGDPVEAFLFILFNTTDGAVLVCFTDHHYFYIQFFSS